MKPLFVVLLSAMLVHAATALAQSARASPLFGSWAVDVSPLPVSPEVRPKSVNIMFSDAGGESGRRRSRSSTLAERHVDARAGQRQPGADLATAKMPGPNVLIMMLGKGGVPASTRVDTVAADGKSMVETAAYFGQDGRPIMRTTTRVGQEGSHARRA